MSCVARVPAQGSARLTPYRTYPKQTGIKPIPLNWGAPEPTERGPIVVSRYSSTIRRRNGTLYMIDFTIWSYILTLYSYRRSVQPEWPILYFTLTRRYCSAHGGSYSIYYALALASKELKADHRYVAP